MRFGVLFVGTHRRPHRTDPADIAFGIYQFRLESGGFTPHGLTETPQPGWITLHPNGGSLYAVNEVRSLDGSDGSGVSAFAYHPQTGALTFLNRMPTPPMPCHCAVDATGRFLLVATFGGGSVHLYQLAADGSIGGEADVHRHAGSSIHPRQTQPHAHAVAIHPGNRFVLVPDLGTDTIVVYEIDHQHARLVPLAERNVSITPGSGPRHIAFDRSGAFAYLITEISAMILVFAFDPSSAILRELQMIDLLPAGFSGHRSGAEIGMHPSGRFVYATTRSHGSSGEPRIRGLDSIAWFAVDPTNGTLEFRGRIQSGGELPRSFDFDAGGGHLFVGHQASGTIVTFRIDQESGALAATGEVTHTPVPVCVRFYPDG